MSNLLVHTYPEGWNVNDYCFHLHSPDCLYQNHLDVRGLTCAFVCADKWLSRYLDSSSITVKKGGLTANLLKDFPRHCESLSDEEEESSPSSQGVLVAPIIKEMLRQEGIGLWDGDELQSAAVIGLSALGKLLREKAEEPYTAFSSIWRAKPANESLTSFLKSLPPEFGFEMHGRARHLILHPSSNPLKSCRQDLPAILPR